MARRLDPDDITDQLSELVNEESSGDGAMAGATDDGDPQSDGVTANRVEVAGIGIELDTLTDEFTGKTWTIPTGKFDEDVFHSSPFDIANKDPRFHYAAYRVDEVGDMQAQGFVPVTRKETKIDHITSSDSPQPLDSYHTIGSDMVLMKIPQVLADRRYATQKRLCDLAVKSTNVRPSENDAIKSDGQEHEVSRDLISAKRAFDREGNRIN
jgi:hypothetical protein